MQRLVQRKIKQTDWIRPNWMSELLYRVLLARGISSDNEARRYLDPDLGELIDPFMLNDMTKAVDIIRGAVADRKKITVYGDYDVDGVCASTILARYLGSIGADVSVCIPDRHKDGYGLNENAVRKLAASGCEVLVTVDCGISSVKEIALAGSLGITAVVTDHHTPADELPDCPVVNPLLGGYPFPYLCGAGVAFKTVAALGGMDAALRYIEFAALATVADVVSLTGENRIITHFGIMALNDSRYPGITALRRVSRLDDRDVNAMNVAFGLAPRINACGRMSTAETAFKLLMTDDSVKAAALAEECEEQNLNRRDETARVLDGLRECIEGFSFGRHKAIVLRSDDCPSGVAGLVAGKLCESYNMPAVVLSKNNGAYTGSCRSIEGINIHDALKHCEDLLVRYGGHSQAAGLTIDGDKIDAFIDRLDEYISKTVSPELYIPVVEYDAQMDISDLTSEAIGELSVIEPTGHDNPAPSILIRGVPVYAKAVGSDFTHLKFSAAQDDRLMPMIWFGHADLLRDMPEEAMFVIEPQNNTFRGVTSPQGNVRAMVRCEQNMLSARCFLTDVMYNYNDMFAAVDAEYVRKLMQTSAFGTVVVCQTPENAYTVRGMLEGCLFDIDPEGRSSYPYNSVALRPDPDVLKRYDNVILLSSENGISGELFDKDGLRRILVAMRKSVKGAVREEECAAKIAGDTGFGIRCVSAALKALEEMKLVLCDDGYIMLPPVPPRSADPEMSTVYRTISYMRKLNETAEEVGACRIRAMLL